MQSINGDYTGSEAILEMPKVGAGGREGEKAISGPGNFIQILVVNFLRRERVCVCVCERESCSVIGSKAREREREN